MNSLNFAEYPNSPNKLAIVTGANIGLGYETAKKLASKEVEVIIASRNISKAETAKSKILQEFPHAKLSIIKLDLAEKKSIQQFVSTFHKQFDQLDILINNAGVFMPPYSKTADGFELQMGVNYLGHFYLTQLLIDTLERTEHSRIVHVASLASNSGEIDFDDIFHEKKYNKFEAYAQSKLANLIFSFELARRLQSNSFQTKSIAAHPGLSDTNISRHLPQWIYKMIRPIIVPRLFQSSEDGALPTLVAALGPHVENGDYYGPSGWKQYTGQPKKVGHTTKVDDVKLANKLWLISENYTDKFPLEIK